MAFVVFYIIGVISSVLLNLLIIIVLLRKVRDITYMDLIMVSLSLSDLIQAAAGYSIEIYSISYENIMSETRCKIGGFTVTFLALVSISHLVGIAVERCVILKYPMKARTWLNRPLVALFVIIPSWLYGLLWAVLPLIGWSSYKRENGATHRCGIDLVDRSTGYVSYSYSLLVFCYVIPVLVISVCCYFIRGTLKLMQSQGEALGVAVRIVASRGRMERKQSIMSLVMICAFLLAWTPYAACVLVLTARGSVSSSLHSIAAVFGKTSTMYNPIIYSIFMKDFRVRCKTLFRLRSNVVYPGTRQVQHRGNVNNVPYGSRRSRCILRMSDTGTTKW